MISASVGVRRLSNGLSTFLPSRWRRRLAYKLLRSLKGPDSALAELMVEPYSGWVDWCSGLGDAHLILYSIARMIRPTTVVEIGSSRGKSTCALALACEHNQHGMVHAIDPHTANEWTHIETGGDTLGFLRQKLADYRLESRCVIIQSTSVEAARRWDRPIDLLFIDGDHSLEMVKHDFDAFRRWLSEDALIAFHDSLWDYNTRSRHFRDDMGVPAFLQSLQDAGFNSVTFGPEPGLTILDPRVPPRSFLVDSSRPTTARNR